MHPLNTFPELLVLERLAPFLLRVSVGILLVFLGSKKLKGLYTPLSFLYFIFGATLIFGLYTQISSLAGIALLKLDFYLEYWMNRKTKGIPPIIYFFYTISVVVLLSLLLTGAGAWAMDIPL